MTNIKYYIYKIIDIVTQEFYIGCRKYEGNPENDNYMGSFGENTWQPNPDNLEKQILGIFSDKVEAYQLEEELIHKCREKFDNCVNGVPTPAEFFIEDKSGENSYWYGKTRPKETRDKISKSLIGKGRTKETRDKISENSSRYWKGKTLTKKHRDKISKNNSRYWKGKKRTRETREKISKAISGENHHFYGEKHTKETRDKISENHSSAKQTQCLQDNCCNNKIYNSGKKCAEAHDMKSSSVHYHTSGKAANPKFKFV
ncbi:NUMOD3 domain-containing DNA-binding protein [Aliifodinibius sp. S!AR15-10]|uniref:NUMOD3 domain-containing DNA-binding protein n=1 Tax=Aliifodinibius sp. S!AR15-10 TaxID=2950437 RepID=UPI00285C7445|nr:NUMOD3 domain-containing DNA-binding protein [Aliifodinibius sp. S!AR15-10]MDR8390972.1 NUMOD3 domain-containing DNA-binding protein [Aliifodinibius sp. S!AR15-10]